MPAESSRATRNACELDELTLRRAQHGDPSAQQAFVQMYERLVFRIIGRVLLRADAASIEDVAQDTFLAALKALPSFRHSGTAKLSTWLATIATRRAIDAARRRRSEEGVLQADDSPSAAGSSWQTVALVRALVNLPPEHRAAFVLRELEGYSYDEIAAALAVPIGTVKSRLARAREALRAQLTEGES